MRSRCRERSSNPRPEEMSSSRAMPKESRMASRSASRSAAPDVPILRSMSCRISSAREMPCVRATAPERRTGVHPDRYWSASYTILYVTIRAAHDPGVAWPAVRPRCRTTGSTRRDRPPRSRIPGWGSGDRVPMPTSASSQAMCIRANRLRSNRCHPGKSDTCCRSTRFMLGRTPRP